MKRAAALLLLLTACQREAPNGVVKEAPSAATASATPKAAEPAASSPAPAPATSSGVKVVPGASDMDALSQIRTARLEAKAAGRVLVVYVGATWCDPCKKMKAEIEAGRLDAKLPKITLLAFDADKDQERLATIGYAFKYVPYVALPGADGQPSDSAEARGKGAQAWRELLGKLEEWQGR